MNRDRRSIGVRSLLDLWQKYTTFQTGQLAPSTIKRDYRKVERRLEKMAKADLNNAVAIRDWLLEEYSADTARRTLIQFNACCKWAMNSDLITRNPFEGIPQQMRSPKRSPRQWAAFTARERDVIIQEIDRRCVWGSTWTKFLFWTGCRPEEAAALKWEHVAIDHREILICEAFPVDMQEAQATKNYKTTRFPCNARLQSLLAQQRPSPWERSGFVFPGPQGGRFDYHGFQSRHWKPIVQDLCDRGLVAFYLPQYHCRHTFITEGLRAGISVPDMSYLVRTSTTVLYKHYVDRTRAITVPEF